jgi:biotin carboxylase
MQLKGKRLLFLGGVQAVCEVIKEAKKLGIYVMETDYIEDSPAKKLVNKSFMVSATDVNAVIDLCRKENVDGIFTCYTDMLLPYCQQTCSLLGKPFWGNEENIRMCIDKQLFKTACLKSDVPVVPWKLVTPDTLEKSFKDISFPVVIKPADNSGSRGVSKCYEKQDYLALCNKAFSFSKKKELMVEKLMDVNSEFSVYYFIHDGIAHLTSMGDRYVDVVNPQSAPQAKGMLLPSIHLDDWIELMDEKVKGFFKDNDMNEGYVFIQGFHEEGRFYLSEIGYRLNGGDTYKIVDRCSGVNIAELLLEYALTGEVEKEKIQKFNPYFKEKTFLVTVALKNGQIHRIEGMESIEKHPNVCGISQMHFVGDILDTPGTNAQVFCYFMCVAENKETLIETILYIKENLHVSDIEGNDMLVGVIDPSIIRFE